MSNASLQSAVAPIRQPVSAAVVGYGSIGARHTRVLEGLGCTVKVVSRRPHTRPDCCPDLRSALAAAAVNYVVLANETSLHAAALRELVDAGYRGRVLVEKPLAASPEELSGFEPADAYLGYNLRYDPVLLRLRELLGDTKVIAAEIRACSYLPWWRKGRDYRQTESARLNAGGGVLRDLSHELDYATWLFGRWRQLAARGGRLGTLEIDTDDAWAIVAETDGCPLLTISLSYLDRHEERRIIVTTSQETIHADLVARRIMVNGEVVFDDAGRSDDDTYIALHQAMLSGDIGPGCTFAEGREVLQLIVAVEQASQESRWVRL